MELVASALEEFGSILIQRVRDPVISEWDLVLTGHMKGVRAQRIRERVASFDAEQIAVLQQLITQVVDSTLHHLLWTLEQESDRIRIAVQTPAGEVPNLAEESDGFPGELYTENGWIERFSEQPYVDPLEGLGDIQAR